MAKSLAKQRQLSVLLRGSGLIASVLSLVAVRVATAQSTSLAQAYPQTEAPAAAFASEETPTYRAYSLRQITTETARQRVSEVLANTRGVEVVADAAHGRIVVRGNSQTHQIVAQLLSGLDRPAVAQTLAPAADGQLQVQAYPLNYETRPIFAAWEQQVAGRADIRVASDTQTSQAVVRAPEDVHAQIRQQLAQIAPPAAATNQPEAQPADGDAAAIPPPANALAPPAGTITLGLRHVSAVELHGRLERLLARPLPTAADVTGEWQSFAVEASPGVGVTMSISIQAGQVRIDGPPLQVAAWRSVVEAIDSPPATQDAVTQVVATKPANYERVRKALQVLQTKAPAGPNNAGSLVAMLFQPREGEEAEGEDAPPTANAAQTAAAAAQPPAEDVPPALQTAQDAIALAEAGGGLLGPVQVDFVEGLDVIVIQGNERDVQRVMEIINRIEELSQVTVPAIEIYELKNVGSESMGQLMTRLYAQVLGPRLGEVSITALGKPNALLLIGRTENVQTAIDLIQRLDQPAPPSAQFEVFTLRNASAAEAKTIIDGVIGRQGLQPAAAEGEEQPTPAAEQLPTLNPRALVVADPRTNSLIVSAAPRDLAEVAALIERIDTPGVSATLKVFTVRNGDATSLVVVLRELFGVATDQAGGAAAGPGVGPGGPVRVQFSVDPRTNSIIAAGSQDDLAVVEAILLRLNQGDLSERINRVYRLKNAYSENVAFALQSMLQTERTAETEAELTISPFEQIEREVVIVPEVASNSLIISATPRYYERIIDLVEELDDRPPMVLIQVLIAEVRLGDTDQFGVELGLQDSLLFDRSNVDTANFLTLSESTQTSTDQGIVTQNTQTIINQPGIPGFSFNDPSSGVPLGNNLSDRSLLNASNVAAQGLSNFAVNRLDPTLGFSGFLFSASSDAVSVLLRALQEKRRVEVLSRPQLMALDGQPGFVQVGQDVPTVTGVSLTQFGQTNNIIYRQVGLILEVVPRISPDGLVVMYISAIKSEVGPESEGIPISFSTTGVPIRAPRFEVTQAQTTISALSGQTVVLGGLIQTRKADVHRRVPIIADIPLIGDLFRYDSVQDERRELLIVLTPQIIYNRLDSDLVKQIESSRMSYCLADVVNVHGEAGLRSRCDEWFDGETEAVYPTYVPKEGEILPLNDGTLMSPAQGPMLQMPPMGAPPAINPLEALPVPPPGGALPVPPPPAQPPSGWLPKNEGKLDPALAPAGYDDYGSGKGVGGASYQAPFQLPPASQ